MDTGLAAPRATTAPSANMRTEPAVQTAVATELQAARSVTAATDTHAAPAYDSALRAPARQDTALNIVLDPQSREVIFREILKRSGEVIDQVPGEAMLKLRAYYREIANPESDRQVEKTT
jgi:flagellar protein FlaG